jgi:hypothetical protein
MLKLLVGVAKSFLILHAACAAKSGETPKMKIVIVTIEQVASNTSSLLLLIQIYNTQTLQLFAKIIKIEIILQKLLKCQAERLGSRVQVV